MRRFIVEIEIKGNADHHFSDEDEREVVGKLVDVVQYLESGFRRGSLRDINGNTVGWFGTKGA